MSQPAWGSLAIDFVHLSSLVGHLLCGKVGLCPVSSRRTWLGRSCLVIRLFLFAVIPWSNTQVSGPGCHLKFFPALHVGS